MPIQFHKTSIRSRKRTLGLAAIGLLVEAIASHPKVDVKGMVNVAMMSRFAAAPLTASPGSLTRTSTPPSENGMAAAPVNTPEHVAWNCARRRIDS